MSIFRLYNEWLESKDLNGAYIDVTYITVTPATLLSDSTSTDVWTFQDPFQITSWKVHGFE